MNMKGRLKKFWNSGLLYDLFSGKERTYTRKINPKMGLLGFLGFCGFLGLMPDFISMPFPFLFFAFFGFFGFYYEGKMSHTLIDERFKTNAYRAEAVANKVSMFIIVFITIAFILRFKNLETVVSLLIATIGLAFGISVFLQQYLLYHFENEE